MWALTTSIVLSAALAGGPVSASQQDSTKAGQPTKENNSSASGGFVRQIGRDFRHFVDPGNLLVIASGGVASLAVHSHDRELTDDFRNSAALDGFFEAGDIGGGDWVQGGGAVATYIVGRLARSNEVRSLGSDLVRAQMLTGVVTLGLKVATQRTRPDGSNQMSFPSGHSSATFATATVLERHFGWKVGVPAFLFATYVAGSRVQENKHFPSDVIFGAAIGIAGGRSVTFGRGRGLVALAPFALPGGGLGVAVVGCSR